MPGMRSTLIAALATVVVAAQAQTVQPAPPSPQSAPLVPAEVRKVDREAGKLTLRHGAIPNLDMAAMTMSFRVADPKLLETVREGDKLRFAAERIGGALTVTRIEADR